jgi:hypothetical protein
MAADLAVGGIQVIAYFRRPDQMAKLDALGLQPTIAASESFSNYFGTVLRLLVWIAPMCHSAGRKCGGRTRRTAMQVLQAHRASIIVSVAAAVILVSTGFESAQAPSTRRVVNEGTAVQVTSAEVRPDHRYRAAQWLVDMMSDRAPSAGNEAFTYETDTIFLSIFWTTYIPIVIVILPLIGDWLMRRFRKLRASFASLISTHAQAELRTARSSGGPNLRG